MYEPSDADVKLLLADLKIDAKQAGARNQHERLQLLCKALQKTQRLSKVLKKAADSSDADAPLLLDPSTLKKLNSRSKLVAEKFDVDEMYSMQEKFACNVMSPEIHTAWFELRRTLCNVIEKHVQEGTKRLHMLDNHKPPRMGGVIDFLGARVTPDGKVPVLETRHRFYHTHQVTKEYAAVEHRTNPLEKVTDSVIMEVEVEELKLMAVLFDANASRLSPSYIDAQQLSWGTGTHLTPSFLLPIEPLTQEVTINKQCKVCSKEGARDCSGCRTVAYCGKECQQQDWKAHKAACKAAQAAQAANSTSVTVDTKAAQPEATYVTNLPMNASVRSMFQGGRANLQAQLDPRYKPSGVSDDVVVDPAKRFVVKVQAPVNEHTGMGRGDMPLYLYNQRRTVVAYIHSKMQPAFTSIKTVIRQHGYMGAKLYCWAAMDAKDQLRVFTDPLPSQMQSW